MAENLCHTALEKFKNKYGVIKNVSDKKFFTNSIHVPVWKQVDPFQKIDIESQLSSFTIIRVFLEKARGKRKVPPAFLRQSFQTPHCPYFLLSSLPHTAKKQRSGKPLRCFDGYDRRSARP